MSPSDPNKTVFISYRRKVSSFIARAIFMDLRANGYDVFMDVENIDSGTFDTIILNQIAARAHFLVILTPGTLNRCVQEGDWLRREIEYAMEQRRNIIPVMVNDFRFGSKIKKYLPGQLESLPRLNALTLPHEYFDAGMEKLRNRFLKQPMSGAILTPAPAAEQTIVAEKIEETARQPRPTEIELSAEQWLARALDKLQIGNLRGAIADYSEAIHLNSDYAYAYNNRGVVWDDQEDWNQAIADYNKAIQIEPEYAEAYNNRGVTWAKQGNLTKAIADFNKAIKFRSNYTDALSNRAEALFILHKYEKALKDFKKADELRPNYPTIIGGLAITHHAMGNVDEAKRLWGKLVTQDERYRDVEWVREEFDWADALVEEARKLIAEL